MKTCSKCGEAKPLDDFYKKPGATDGRFADCKVCVLADRKRRYESDPDFRARLIAYAKDHPYPQDPDERRAAGRRRYEQGKTPGQPHRQTLAQYGLTPESYDEMFETQDRCCAICRSPEPGRFWTIDHDHVTGRVRGILCWHCNVGLGHFRDDIVSLIAAAEYVLRARDVVVPFGDFGPYYRAQAS